MIWAGIDEAGYGPLLGPLVVGCCAFEVGDVDVPPGSARLAGEEWPCLWKRLRKHVSKTRVKTGRKLHVNDSKLVYSPAGGLKELERSVLALAAAAGIWPEDCRDLVSLLARTAAHAVDDLGGYDWYKSEDPERFPLEQEALPIRLLAKGLREEMMRNRAGCIHLAARVVFERQLNQMFDTMRNKAGALFQLAAIHLDHLLRTYGEQDLTIVCDRQGGRGHYGGLLRLMFEEWSLEIVSEAESRSDYVLTRNGHPVRIIFTEKAEGQCMSVAVASMLSKYLREAMMSRFNRYWRTQVPDLPPTAGYYNDGLRFLKDIDARRRELGIADGQLIRSR
jgi:hypothetical protein